MAAAVETPWMTIEQAAGYCQVTPQTVWRWLTTGLNGRKLEGYRAGRPWRVTRAACDRFVGLDAGADGEPQGPAAIEIPPDQLALLENLQRRGVFTNGGHQGWQGTNKPTGQS